MAYVGGLRARLVKQSAYEMLYEALDDLHWFDAGRNHEPINFVNEDMANELEVPLNTLSLADGDIDSQNIEMGSNLAEHTWAYYVDFFGESDQLSIHMAYDIKDILEGRMSSIGRTGPMFTVYDYTQATPPELFKCEIQGVSMDRALNYSKPWQKYWRSISFVVVDEYADDADA